MYFLWFFSLIAVPQKGILLITTEFGKIEVKPNEICVIQVEKVDVKEHAVTGYILLVDRKDVVVDYLNVLYCLFSARNEVFSGN